MIGFDLDGIFVPDFSEGVNVIKALEIRTTHFKPIFVPSMEEYAIITGRPVIDRKDTLKFLKKYNFNLKYFFQNNSMYFSEDEVVAFKAKIINESFQDDSYYPPIKFYIESSEYQTNKLNLLCPGTKITQFSVLINTMMGII